MYECEVVATISNPNASFVPQIELLYVSKASRALRALVCCTRGALMHGQPLCVVVDTCESWHPVAGCGVLWQRAYCSYKYRCIATDRPRKLSSADSWQTQLPRVTSMRKSLVVICVQAPKVIFFQPVPWHSRLMWGGFAPGHAETVVGRKGNSFTKEMAVEEEGF